MNQIEILQNQINAVEIPTTTKSKLKIASVKKSSIQKTESTKNSVLNSLDKKIDKTINGSTAKAKPIVAKKLTKEEVAVAKKRVSEGNELMKIYSSVIVPTWFGQADVAKTINKPKIGPETALCLVYIGVRGDNGCSKIGIEINLRPSGFDRSEAWLFAEMGCSSLIGHKLAKYAKKQEEEKDCRLRNLILTKKGQDLFDLIKRVALQDPGKGSFMI